MVLHEEANPRSIGAISRRHGVTLRALRFYEDFGLLAPVRVDTMRIYTAHDEVRLRLIATGKRLGMSLRCIREIIDATVISAGQNATDIVAFLSAEQIRARLHEMEERRDELDGALLELRAAAALQRSEADRPGELEWSRHPSAMGGEAADGTR